MADATIHDLVAALRYAKTVNKALPIDEEANAAAESALAKHISAQPTRKLKKKDERMTSDMMSTEKIQALLNAAPMREMRVDSNENGSVVRITADEALVAMFPYRNGCDVADAALFSIARQLVADLFAQVDRLKGELGQAEGGKTNAEQRAAHEWTAHKKTIEERDVLRAQLATMPNEQLEALLAIDPGHPCKECEGEGSVLREGTPGCADDYDKCENCAGTGDMTLINAEKLRAALRATAAALAAMTKARDEACTIAGRDKLSYSLVKRRIDELRAVGKAGGNG